MSTESTSLPDHLLRPHIRPVQPIQVNKDGKQFIALRDPSMLSQQTMVVPPQVLGLVQHFRGERTIHEIAQQIGAPIDQCLELVQALDKLGLLWGPTFEQLEETAMERLKEAGAFPVLAAGSLGKNEAACRKQIEEYFEQTEDPELEGEVRAIVAPHLDYQRGWPNYAAAYYGLRDVEPPDRVVILGTNHFGIGDGVVMTEYGFTSPMGQCPTDKAVFDALHEKHGRKLIVDQLDHLPEHSVQLHLPWLQFWFGNVPIVAALIPDPLTPMIENNDERLATAEFVTSLTDVLEGVGGRTFFVASSDLSHVGPQFGEPRAVDEQRRIEVERHDRDMMGKFLTADAEEFLSAFEWNKNPTRWCSVGNMSALLQLTQPEAIELIDYRQAYDEKGSALVSSAAMALY